MATAAAFFARDLCRNIGGMSKEKCTKELVAKATELVSSGLRNKDVIEYLGISDSAFYGWLKNPRTENQVALAESLQKARIDRK